MNATDADNAAAPVDIASAVGTWAAVLLAIVALVGIIAPWAILRATRSDRYRALRKVDTAGKKYVRQKLKLGSVRWLVVEAPLLHLPPGSKGAPKLEKRVGAKPKDISKANDPLLPGSGTGWVNLAALAGYYAKDVKYGDVLVVHRGNTWFPIHRFYILALGLRGRYSHRADKGEKHTVETSARLITETIDNYDENMYMESRTADKLYGTTGILWWRKTLDMLEVGGDEVYFGMHPDVVTKDDGRDDTSIDELFWLALGCLPGKNREGKIVKVYDLSYKANAPHRTEMEDRHSRKKKKAKGKKPRVELKQRKGLVSGHRVWAEAMRAEGIKYGDVYYFDVKPDVSEDDEVLLHPQDLEVLALAVLRMTSSPHGIMMPPNKNILRFFGDVVGDAWKSLFEHCKMEIPGLEPILLGLKEVLPGWHRRQFSRQRAQRCHDITVYIKENGILREMNPALWSIAVLTLTTGSFLSTVDKYLYSDEITDPNGIVIDVLPNMIAMSGKKCNIGVKELYAWFPDTSFPGDCPSKIEKKDAAHEINGGTSNLPTVQLGGVPGSPAFSPTQHKETRTRILATLLLAFTRLVAADNRLDSKHLLETVAKMGDVVHVSSSTSARAIYSSIQRTRSNDYEDGGFNFDDDESDEGTWSSKRSDVDSLLSVSPPRRKGATTKRGDQTWDSDDSE